MKPLVLDPETFTIKVISIDINSISKETFDQLKEYPTYEDTLIGEDLYSCEVRDDMRGREVINDVVSTELEQIEELCKEHDASYFRVVDL